MNRRETLKGLLLAPLGLLAEPTKTLLEDDEFKTELKKLCQKHNRKGMFCEGGQFLKTQWEGEWHYYQHFCNHTLKKNDITAITTLKNKKTGKVFWRNAIIIGDKERSWA